MAKKLAAVVLLMIIAAGFGGLFGYDNREVKSSNKLIVYCSAPNYFNAPIIQEFENTTGIKVELVKQTPISLLQRLEQEADNPQADVLWSGSLNIVRQKQELFENYRSANEAFVKDEFKNKEGCFTRFTELPNVLLVNTKLAGDIEIKGYADLLNPALKGKIAFADPAESTSAYEHLVNMLYAMGNGEPETGWQYIQKFCQNLDGRLLRTADAVYQGVADGEFVVGCTYEQSGLLVKDDVPLKIVYMREGVVSQTDGLYIIKNCTNKLNAQRFIDFMTDKNTQTFIAEKYHRRSVRQDVALPKEILAKEQLPVIAVNNEMVSTMSKTWLDRFHTVFIHIL